MVRLGGGLLLLAAFAVAAPADAPPSNVNAGLQQILAGPPSSQSKSAPRKLHGRFLHITDIHPDPFYKSPSNPDQACHSGKGVAGYYGAEVTECDTPFTLVDATFKWIEDHIKDKVDFVIWTGDSARHDNDERFPRSDKQVIKLNRQIVDKFVEVFGKPDNVHDPDPTNDFIVPIVPTFGNNDILPHNIFVPGPNKWTRAFVDVWDKFVPQAQRHSFARGGWFFSEVIPNKLAVISLNTLYFFDSNSAVDGCDLETEPGYEHMEWLRIQLQFLRDRGMKAILIGHVPPARTGSKQSWDESCYQKYTLWMRQYRDVVIASMFGHMNLDHFMFQDVKQLKYKFKIKGVDNEFERLGGFEGKTDNDTLTVAAKAQYLNELRSGFSALPKPPSGFSYVSPGNDLETEKKKKKKKKPDPEKELEKFLDSIGGPWAERFSLSLVSPSVVPNFFPTLRIVEYNLTGLEHDHPADRAIGEPANIADVSDLEDAEEFILEEIDEILGYDDMSDEMHDLEMHDLRKKRRKKKGRKKKHRKPTFPVPKPPSKSSPPGPGYSPQSLSLLSLTQYYANLTEIHTKIPKHPDSKNAGQFFEYQVEYMTNNDSAYQMKDLTVRSWLDVAERIGRDKLETLEGADELNGESHGTQGVVEAEKKKSKTTKNHLWKVFVKRAFVHTKPDEDINDDFG